MFKKPVVHCLGDSHTEVFSHINFSRNFGWSLVLKTKTIHGATATGLANPNSKTKAKKSFLNYIESEVRSEDYVLLQLGEVDCGFAIWYRAAKHGLSVDHQLTLATNNYNKLVQEAKQRVGNKVVICSAVPPTIRDNQIWGQVANKRAEVKISQIERTRLTIRFNNILKIIASENDVFFLDMDVNLIDKESGVVDETFLNKNTLDHHLDHDSYASALYPKLLTFIK